jgi:amino-acid N-acetyltransferase
LIRNATILDVPDMAEVINFHAGAGRMLFKNHAQLYESIRDYAVYEEEGKVIGVVALGIIWADLAEVRALAVAPDHQGKGIGRKLVEWCLADARRMGIRKLMSLTYEERFFAKLGFVVVQKETLPLKVWTDCVKCPKNQNCDEIAMVRELEDVPRLDAAQALPTPKGIRIPVLPYVSPE